jgi:ATP-binding cassette, subfamily G (WHITE), member 2, PDR
VSHDVCDPAPQADWLKTGILLYYSVQGFTGVGISGTNVVCAPQEFITFDPPSGETCQSYTQTFIETSGGYLANPNATTACDFCTFSSTSSYLAQYDIHYYQRWRNFGLLWSYILFNIVAALFFYWLARVVCSLVLHCKGLFIDVFSISA